MSINLNPYEIWQFDQLKIGNHMKLYKIELVELMIQKSYTFGSPKTTVKFFHLVNNNNLSL